MTSSGGSDRTNVIARGCRKMAPSPRNCACTATRSARIQCWLGYSRGGKQTWRK
jgi:hypothetical protein